MQMLGLRLQSWRERTQKQNPRSEPVDSEQVTQKMLSVLNKYSQEFVFTSLLNS